MVDSHLHVWDGTAAGLDAGPMKIGYSAQATASVELFMDYMDEAGVDRAVFVQPWFFSIPFSAGQLSRRSTMPSPSPSVSGQPLFSTGPCVPLDCARTSRWRWASPHPISPSATATASW